MTPQTANPLRFGLFELDTDTAQLRKAGQVVRLQPQPFKLLHMLVSKPGRLLTRDEIRVALWTEGTFIDFEQGVNYAIKQVREALNDDSDNPLYIQTVPKRGYRFIAPVEGASPAPPKAHTITRGLTTDLNLHKVLWTNIAEMRVNEQRREKQMKLLIAAAVGMAGVIVVAVWWALR